MCVGVTHTRSTVNSCPVACDQVRQRQSVNAPWAVPGAALEVTDLASVNGAGATSSVTRYRLRRTLFYTRTACSSYLVRMAQFRSTGRTKRAAVCLAATSTNDVS